MKKILFSLPLLFLAVLSFACLVVSCSSIPPQVVLRSELFGQDSFRSPPKISPDGTKIAWLECPFRSNCRLQIRDVKTGATHLGQIPGDKFYSGFASFLWRSDSKHLLYWHSKDADENYHLIEFNPENGDMRDLTPFRNSHARLLSQSKDRIVYATNNRDPHYFDVYEVRLKAGTITRVFQNPGDVMDWLLDDDDEIVGIVRNKGLTQEVLLKDGLSEKFEKPGFLPENFELLNLSGSETKDGSFLVRARMGKDGASLVSIHPKTKSYDVLASDDHFDSIGGKLNRKTGALRYFFKETRSTSCSRLTRAFSKIFKSWPRTWAENSVFSVRIAQIDTGF